MDKINNSWVRASYSEGQMSSHIYVSKLNKIGERGRYHIYHMEQGDKYVVIFHNQQKLRELVDSSPDALFLVGFLKPSNNKFSYPATINGEEVDLTTVAKAQILIPEVSTAYSKELMRIQL